MTMTNAEILARILHETTGKPEQHCLNLVAAIAETIGAGRLYESRPKAEAEKLLKTWSGQKEGIFADLIRGAVEAREMLPPDAPCSKRTTAEP